MDNTLSGPVDVLAVLDDLHRGCRMYSDSEGRANRTNYADDLIERRSPEARAAVAELIETLRARFVLVGRLGGNTINSPYRGEWEFLRAALANVGGAK